jgi:hypothetical protein
LALIPPAYMVPRLGRHFLIANDPRLDPGVLDALAPESHDAIVQFNGAALFDRAAGFACRKLHVFQGNGVGLNFGFDAEGRPLRDWRAQQATEIILVYTFWKCGAIARGWPVEDTSIVEHVVSPTRHLAAWRYPDHFMPSAGFIIAAYLRQVNVARYLLGLPVFPIVTVGFTGVYPQGLGWAGHDFDYEQAALRTWLDVERLGLDGGTL